ncbi:MAG TPA: hypothetical protein PLQ22_01090 [Bacilli bacterium]|nr:hypothetical protein [Bacilli bacterium]
MKKKSRISKEEILLVMSQEIKEKFQCSTFKVLDWGEAMERQERNLIDPQDFGKIRYALF